MQNNFNEYNIIALDFHIYYNYEFLEHNINPGIVSVLEPGVIG